MTFTYYGHACFGVEVAGLHLLFDPFISGNPLLEGKDIDLQSIPADYILLSHGHGDHVADVEAIATLTGAPIISNFEIVSYFEAKGLKGHPMNHGGSWTFPFGKVKCVNAVHSSVLPDGTYGGNPMGFVIETAEGNFYFAGDTALTWDMKLIPMICKPLDIAIFPIGSNFTMDFDDAVIASDFVECDRVIGCHYDTFGFIKIDHEAAKSVFSARNKYLFLLELGGILSLD